MSVLSAVGEHRINRLFLFPFFYHSECRTVGRGHPNAFSLFRSRHARRRIRLDWSCLSVRLYTEWTTRLKSALFPKKKKEKNDGCVCAGNTESWMIVLDYARCLRHSFRM